MTALTDFENWWQTLPESMRLNMNKGDLEFAWISSSNAHQQLVIQAKHAEEIGRITEREKIISEIEEILECCNRRKTGKLYNLIKSKLYLIKNRV